MQIDLSQPLASLQAAATKALGHPVTIEGRHAWPSTSLPRKVRVPLFARLALILGGQNVADSVVTFSPR